MFKNTLAVILTIGGLLAVPAHTRAEAPTHEPADTQAAIGLTPGLLELLRAEMREIAGGVQGMALSLATADWESVAATSAKIRASYIMEKQLTPAQVEELQHALPEHFKLLDAGFHERAEKLGEAALAHDGELAVFHYSRLVESCVACHSAFAGQRFPGFVAPGPAGHHH